MKREDIPKNWKCGDCGREVVVKSSLVRHWNEKRRADRGHLSTPVLIRLGSRGATPAASAAVPAPVRRRRRRRPRRRRAPPAPSPPQSPSSAPDPFLEQVGFAPDFPRSSHLVLGQVPVGGDPALPSPFIYEDAVLPSDDEANIDPQLRSSRSTRNQDHQAAMRNRPGAVDLDPTEGLPVTKWGQQSITINQDPSSDPSAPANFPGSNAMVTGSAEWNAQFNTSTYPFEEKQLPAFFSQLAPHNQELVRRARTGNTNATLSTWNSKLNNWNSGAEMEKRQNAIKSGQFGTVNQNAGLNQKAVPDTPAHDDEEDHDDKSDEDAEEHGDDVVEPAIKRRKKFVPEERTFTLRRWAQVPPAIAEKTEERKFLADRRPGMPSLYGGTYQNQVFNFMRPDANGYGFSAANASFDLGDGSGLGNAAGVVQPDEGAAAPVRRNMPPKRKKKKGGPGRKKANPGPMPQNDGTGAGATDSVANLDGTAGEHRPEDVAMGEGEGEGSDSGSEAEGSEEGEIDEGGNDGEKPIEVAASQARVHDVAPVGLAPPVTNGHTTGETGDIDVSLVREHNVAEPAEDPSSVQSQAPTDATALDTIMQDTPAEEITLQVQPVPGAEVIPSITQPPISEQLPETSLEEISAAMPVVEAAPPQLAEPGVALALPEALPAVTAAPIEAPALSSGPAEAAVLVPEPTSPDLLGGLEDELDKKMGEQAAE